MSVMIVVRVEPQEAAEFKSSCALRQLHGQNVLAAFVAAFLGAWDRTDKPFFNRLLLHAAEREQIGRKKKRRAAE